VRVQRSECGRSWVDYALLGATIGVALCYPLLNRRTAHVHVLRTRIDRHIPFAPVFSVPYLLFVPAFWAFVAGAFIRRAAWRPLASAVLATYVVSYIVFATYQTYVPRQHPIGDGFFDRLVRFIYRIDKPYNGFPSLHSSSAAILATYFVVTRVRGRELAVGFAVVVVASTVFVRQHVVADAVSGVALGTTATIVAFRFVSSGRGRRPARPTPPRSGLQLRRRSLS
jgi:membrane-associated phospholipid phosphatase